MRHLKSASGKAAIAITAILLCHPAQAAVRAFVASTGSDSNTATSCSPTTPCRGFTAAMSVVDPGGEIIALDAAGYGAVTVTKSVTIAANPGFYAGVAASSGTAITIATAGVKVVLRGLAVTNNGTATKGVDMTNGAQLTIENSVFANFTTTGSVAVSIAVPAEVRIADTVMRDNYDGVVVDGGARLTITGSRFQGHPGQGGVNVYASSAVTTTVAISDSVFSNNWVGVYTCPSAGTTRVSVTRSTLVGNSFGAANENCGVTTRTMIVSNSLVTGNTSNGLYNNGGTFQSLGNNTGGFNGSNTFGTITTVSGF